jgi:exportin-T
VLIRIVWIDITLIVNEAYLTLIYRFLTHPTLRKAAADTLSSIVSKKMGAADKLNLITFLNVSNVLSELSRADDSDFTESVARLVNAQGLEITRILSEVHLKTKMPFILPD